MARRRTTFTGSRRRDAKLIGTLLLLALPIWIIYKVGSCVGCWKEGKEERDASHSSDVSIIREDEVVAPSRICEAFPDFDNIQPKVLVVSGRVDLGPADPNYHSGRGQRQIVYLAMDEARCSVQMHFPPLAAGEEPIITAGQRITARCRYGGWYKGGRVELLDCERTDGGGISRPAGDGADSP